MRRFCMTVLVSSLAFSTGCLKSPDGNNTETDMYLPPDSGGADVSQDVLTTDMDQTDGAVDMFVPCAPDGCEAGDVCDPESDSCVSCVNDEHCDGDEKCNDVNVCVECLGVDDCASGACSDAGVCVECTGNATCTDPGESFCDTMLNVCVPCSTGEDTQCEHLLSTPICRDDACVVKCDAVNNVCGAKSCNLMTNTCTDTDAGSVGLCEQCVTDVDCMGDAYCIVMQFDGVDRNNGEIGYCLPEFVLGDTCPDLTESTMNQKSIDGLDALTVCGVDQSRTTCEAVFGAAGMDCNDAGECMAEGSVCGPVQGQTPDECTYLCDDDSDCRSPLVCAEIGGPADWTCL